MTLFLDLRASESGGIPAEDVTPRDGFTPITTSKIAALVTGRDVLIGTHGFNVNRSKGVEELSSWETLLTLNSTALFVGLLWPGDSRWAPLVDYPVEGEFANRSGQLLAPFLDLYFAQATSLSFVSHSLGARTVLETIRALGVRVRRLILMAGAIDDDCLIDEYKDAAGKVEKISVLSSRKDTVLSWAFPVGNLLEGLITPGHPFWHSAIGHSGPQAPYPAQLARNWEIPDGWSYGHGDYLPGQPPVAAAMPTPVNVPPQGTGPYQGLPVDWKTAWSAGFVSTRFI
jgi:pimeloyl-ACP methyl ester carboxylesterase